jgi:hypothetical protein
MWELQHGLAILLTQQQQVVVVTSRPRLPPLQPLRQPMCRRQQPRAGADNTLQPHQRVQQQRLQQQRRSAAAAGAPPAAQPSPPRAAQQQPRVVCDVCGRDFASTAAIRRHFAHMHVEQTFPCTFPGCTKAFPGLCSGVAVMGGPCG